MAKPKSSTLIPRALRIYPVPPAPMGGNDLARIEFFAGRVT
jgi:hypothetical protein